MSRLRDEVRLKPDTTTNTTTNTTSDTTTVAAWELIEAGRYMPRRIRGSFRGRELG